MLVAGIVIAEDTCRRDGDDDVGDRAGLFVERVRAVDFAEESKDTRKSDVIDEKSDRHVLGIEDVGRGLGAARDRPANRCASDDGGERGRGPRLTGSGLDAHCLLPLAYPLPKLSSVK